MIDRRRLVLGSASTLLLSLAPWQIARGARMVDVRMWPAEEYTRVTLEYDSPLNFKYFFVRSSKPLRLVVDIKGLELTVALQKQIAAVKHAGASGDLPRRRLPPSSPTIPTSPPCASGSSSPTRSVS